ncbi:MAG: insulinase family protein [Actinomycetia bacterium]|nr:insulinase family protein [Actinomycetes bacterium]
MGSYAGTRFAAIMVVFGLVGAACSGSTPTPEADGPAPATPSTTDPGSTGDGVADLDPDPVPPAPQPDPTLLPIDPDTRVGTLDNGLTYYVRSNDSPGRSLELRLVVNAGSLQEEDGGGTAHFLEHMLFNGTDRYPANDLDSVLRSFGAEIGPDFNAYTSHDETVYLLSLSTYSDDAVETGFDVLHQWATAATISPRAVEAERGIVRQEYREAVETGNGAVFRHFDAAYLENTPYADRSPVGTVEGIETVSAQELRAFYERWYQPDNMAVVAVGDLSADRLETEIVDRFGSIPEADLATEPSVGSVHHRDEPAVSVVTHPDEVASLVSIDFPVPAWDSGTVGGERLLTLEALLAAMMTSRFERAQAGGDLSQSSEPFFSFFSYSRAHRYLGTSVQADELAPATREWFGLLEGLRSDGFTEDELAQALSEYRTSLDIEREIASTIQDAWYAASFVDHFLAGAEIDQAESALDRLDSIATSITLEELDGHLRWLLAQDQPVVIGVGPSAGALPTVGELSAAVAEAVATVEVAAVEAIESLMDPLDPVEPIASDYDPDLEARSWTFANGARVSYVKTEIVDGFVNVAGVGGGGLRLLDEGQAALGWVAFLAVDESGVGDHSALALDRYLKSTSVSLRSFVDQTDEGFTGSSSAADLETLFQLLHLRMTEPRVDRVGLDEAVLAGRNAIAGLARDPQLRTLDALFDARYGDTPGYDLSPPEDALAAIDSEAALAIYESRLGQVDDFVVAVVGDVDQEVVEDLARRYIGTLPAGRSDSWPTDTPPFPSGLTQRDVGLTADTTAAGLLIYAEAAGDFDARDEATAAVLTSIINQRLFEGIREELGASYGGSGAVSITRRPTQQLELFIGADADPERLDEVQAAIVAELNDLATDGPDQSEMGEALSVVGDNYAFTTNWDHLSLLVDHGLMPDEDLLTLDDRHRQLDRVSGAQIRAMADALVGSGDLIVITRSVR